MKQIDFNDVYKERIVLALGFFDCVHLGHVHLIEKTIERAAEIGAESAVFTFSSGFFKLKNKNKRIYTYEERLTRLEYCGPDVVIKAVMTDNLMSTSATDFLDMLFERFSPAEIVVGSDYTFGAKGQGNVELLQSYCQSRGTNVTVCDFLTAGGSKISSKNISNLLEAGDIVAANKLLGKPYFVIGEVCHGFGRGSKIGYPTLNLQPDYTKVVLLEGVYATTVEIDGITYYSMTNVGGRPTFGNFDYVIETNVFDFDGDAYGKTVRINFFRKLREPKRFASIGELTEKLKDDTSLARKILNGDYED